MVLEWRLRCSEVARYCPMQIATITSASSCKHSKSPRRCTDQVKSDPPIWQIHEWYRDYHVSWSALRLWHNLQRGSGKTPEQHKIMFLGASTWHGSSTEISWYNLFLQAIDMNLYLLCTRSRNGINLFITCDRFLSDRLQTDRPEVFARLDKSVKTSCASSFHSFCGIITLEYRRSRSIHAVSCQPHV